MSTLQHPSEFDLALYATGDLPFAARLRTVVHVRGCAHCTSRVSAYRGDREVASRIALTMPRDLDWVRLAEEMTGNIRVGLAAGECVAQAPKEKSTAWPAFGWLTRGKSWQQGVAYACLALAVVGVWWVNTPASETSAMGRIGRALWTQTPVAMLAEPGVTVEASPGGVLVKENGSSMALTSPGNRPVALSVSLQGSARARYVDDDTGQMTITTVYVQ